MRKRNRIISIIILSIMLVSIFTTQVGGRGIGVGPNYIQMDVVRDFTYQRTIYVYNQNEYDSIIHLNSSGDAKDWIKFYEFKNLEKPVNSTFVSNMSDKSLVVKITIPPYAANGEQNGTIIVSHIPAVENMTGNYSTVSLNIPMMVFLNVTGEQNLNISIESIEIEKNVEINKDCGIRIRIKNTGNVEAEPYTDVTITKDGNYIDKLSAEMPAPPIGLGQTKWLTLTWNTIGKISGEYVANFKIYLDKTKQ